MSSVKPINIIIAGIDKFSSVFKHVGKELVELSEKTEKFHKSFEKVGVGLGIGGAGLALSTGLEDLPAMALEQEHALARVGVQAHISKKELVELDEIIMETARNTNQFSGEVLEEVTTQLIKAGFKINDVKIIMSPLGKLATSTGASMADLGKVAIALKDQFNVKPEGMYDAFNTVLLLSKQGKVTLNDFTNSLVSLSTKTKFLGANSGPGTLLSVGAALQIVSKGADSSEEAVSSLEQLLSRLGSKQMLASIFKINPAWGQQYVHILRTSKDPILDLAKFIEKITGGNNQKLAMLFGRNIEGIVALKQLTSNVKDYQAIRQKAASGDDEIQHDFNEVMGTTIEQWKNFKIQLQTTALPELEEPLKKFNDLLVLVNGNAFAMKTILFSIGGFITGGVLLIGIGQIAGALSRISTLLSIIGSGSAIKGLGLAFTNALLPLTALVAALTAAYAIYEGIQTLNTLNDEQNLAAKGDADTRKVLKEKYHLSDDEIDKRMQTQGERVNGKENQNAYLGMGMYAGSLGLGKSPSQRTEHVVTFKNIPPGTKVQSKTSGKDIHLQTELGYAFGGPG